MNQLVLMSSGIHQMLLDDSHPMNERVLEHLENDCPDIAFPAQHSDPHVGTASHPGSALNFSLLY